MGQERKGRREAIAYTRRMLRRTGKGRIDVSLVKRIEVEVNIVVRSMDAEDESRAE